MLLAVPTRIEEPRTFDVKPLANGLLVVANVLALFLMQPAGYLVPGGGWWTVMTYAFAHASPWHLIGNMYVLLIVGTAVNRRLGNFYYLTAYLGTVVAMGVLGRLLGLGPLMGSSGAIFAMVAILLMLMPAARVEFAYAALFPITLVIGLVNKPRDFVGWFIQFGRFRSRAWWCFLIVPLLELWGLMWWRYSLGEWQLAHPAHLLGLICGIAIVLLLPTRITMGRRSSFS